jgi:hypothetical protein
MTLTLAMGSLAYYDSFCDGLVPCKVTEISGQSGPASTSQTITAILTASRGPWKRGEQIMSTGLHVVPRNAIRHVCGQARIRFYEVEAL